MDPAWILLKADGIYHLPAEIIKYLIRQFIIIPRLIHRQMTYFSIRSSRIPVHYQVPKCIMRPVCGNIFTGGNPTRAGG